MSKDSNSKKELENQGWLDNSANKKRLIRWFYYLCGLIILADFIFSFGWHKHAAFDEEQPLFHLMECQKDAFYLCNCSSND